jgi:glycosyltransferase involved in cell wall biosynthesis
VSRLVGEVGVPADRISWSWVGTDTDRFRPADSRPSSPVLRVVTVARLNPAKGYQHALPAMAMLRDRGVDFRYSIVGSGPYESEIRSLVERHALVDRVSVLGSRSSEEVADILRDSDVFVLPTAGLGEGTPAAVCEAMSAGLPIVATEVGGLADMVEEGVSGFLVRPGDARALFDAVVRLSSDPGLRARMGAAARRKAVAEYDYRAVATRILDRIDVLTT